MHCVLLNSHLPVLSMLILRFSKSDKKVMNVLLSPFFMKKKVLNTYCRLKVKKKGWISK